MDPLDIIAQWRRDIARADNGGEEAAVQRLRGEWSAAAGIDAQDALTLAPESDESSRRTGITDDDRT
ncbi:hypothetical protein [Nocardia fluminea]|jgi:hypothetical protein|uniref:Uncharacterized protein n=1 Tax=Nocardia fluminea TaxID=134984 RepID=A0A2N3WXB3_9NOCA|nr:hypothetical protein [Nocardia fluminea]PKV98488.1 hypothetical protein ATK86_0507 [Nocardia fluminea]